MPEALIGQPIDHQAFFYEIKLRLIGIVGELPSLIAFPAFLNLEFSRTLCAHQHKTFLRNMLLLSLLIAFAVRAASVSFPTETNASIFADPSLELRQDSIDLEDQSWVENWAAIGDSYAAGIGSGSRTHFSCSRYNLSYPALMNIDDRLGDNPNRRFTYWACSGHTIDLITNHRFLNDPRNSGQVNSLGEGSQDVVGCFHRFHFAALYLPLLCRLRYPPAATTPSSEPSWTIVYSAGPIRPRDIATAR